MPSGPVSDAFWKREEAFLPPPSGDPKKAYIRRKGSTLHLEEGVAEVEARLKLEENQTGIGAAKIARSWDDGLGQKKLNGKYLMRGKVSRGSALQGKVFHGP